MRRKVFFLFINFRIKIFVGRHIPVVLMADIRVAGGEAGQINN